MELDVIYHQSFRGLGCCNLFYWLIKRVLANIFNKIHVINAERRNAAGGESLDLFFSLITSLNFHSCCRLDGTNYKARKK